MCAIFGTKNKEQFDSLYKLNHKRGRFAFSAVFRNNDGKFMTIKGREYIKPLNNAKYILAHDQAPTSSVRLYDHRTSHPFVYGDWVVAHNGVLTNHKELLKEHNCDVDSSYIPALLNRETKGEVTSIENVCSVLEGTFACWIVNRSSGNIYLVKQGSTLFFDGNTFSSVKFEGSISLRDGVVYLIEDTIAPIGKFKSNNPFALI